VPWADEPGSKGEPPETKLIRLAAISLALAVSVLGGPASAQNGSSPAGSGSTRTDSKILYHNGPVLHGTQTVYLIWYGNWNQSNSSDTPEGQSLVRDFLYGLNNSSYFKINTTYSGPSGLVTVGAET
jgi:hypothetical protein